MKEVSSKGLFIDKQGRGEAQFILKHVKDITTVVVVKNMFLFANYCIFGMFLFVSRLCSKTSEKGDDVKKLRVTGPKSKDVPCFLCNYTNTKPK